MRKLACDIEINDVIKVIGEPVVVDNVNYLDGLALIGGYYQETGDDFFCEYEETDEIIVLERNDL